MNIHAHADYVPPKTWQQFEELCADTFAADWSDPALLRHGRGGQRQHGVDIVGRRGNQWPIGLQCKRKSKWPVERLTVADVNEEIAQALKFRPKLKSFYILTTAPDDVKAQNRARQITARHAARGLFDVIVLGWSEIVRRATLHSAVADKHFGPGGGAPRSPLLATWFASGGRLELAGKELNLTCRELAHEFVDHPEGRLVLRQRESDDLVAQLASYDGRQLTIAERSARLDLRDKLARKEAVEKRLSRGLKLILADPTVASYIIDVYRDSGDVSRAVTGFVNHGLDGSGLIKPNTFKMRVTAPKDPDIYRPWYISRGDVESIMSLMKKRDERYGHGGHTNTVSELPDEVRGAEAIPAVITELIRQLEEGRTIEELRKRDMLDIGEWKIDLAF